MTGPKTYRPMRILVCGGREKTLKQLGIDPAKVLATVVRTLNQLSVCGKRPVTIIHGGATGVDAYANHWADATRTPKEVYPISKDEWDKKGSIAGPMRNTQMLVEGKPDVVLALPGGSGTADMVEKSLKAGKRVVVIKPEECRV